MRISTVSRMLLAALVSTSVMGVVHAATATTADRDQGPPTAPPPSMRCPPRRRRFRHRPIVIIPPSCGLCESISSFAINVRDVGVAGSNPVTPTIDYKTFFSKRLFWGRDSPGFGGEAGGEIQAQVYRAQAPLFEPRFVIAIAKFALDGPSGCTPLLVRTQDRLSQG